MSWHQPPGGEFQLAGKLVSRLGLGTMRLTGTGTWGDPSQVADAIQVLRTAVHLQGITHIDTADAYGPHTVEELIRHALYPYDDQLLIATKVGVLRPGPDHWVPLGRPDYLRAAAQACARRLRVERLELCYLHRIDPCVPLAEQVGVLADLQAEGTVGHIGLSKVTCDQIDKALAVAPIAAVQNPLNRDEPDDPAAVHCARLGIPYIPYRPLGVGWLTADLPGALRWLLDRGDHIAPIPGTSRPEHVRQLVAAVSHRPAQTEIAADLGERVITG
jgi:aryl-alcohol dehydrogenase-like predicted oxidoreductase